VIPLPADDRAFALGAGYCAHERYAVARAAALYGRVDLGIPKRPVRGWVFHRFAAAIWVARNAASFPTHPSSAEPRVCCQVRPSM
jgi:hypothetical protein